MYGLNWESGMETKFKVGDRVKVVLNEWGDTFPVGETGKVQSVLGHGITVSRDGHDDYGWFFSFDGAAPAPAEQVQSGGRYRVGDRVRLTKSVGCFGVSAGRIYEVIGVDEKGVATTAGHFLNFDELTPAFLPGDRVRLNKHSGARVCGERGTVSAVLGDAISVRMDELSYWGGRVAVFPDSVLDWERDEGDRHATSARVPWQGDAADAAPCPQDNEQTRNVETLTIKLDLDTSGFTDKLDAAPGFNRPCIVALIKNGQPRPSTYPHVHSSVQSATTEAERLARINPGEEFAVYQRVVGRVASVTVEMKEVA